jgi:hypothetical protein
MVEHPGQAFLDQLEPRERERKQAEAERVERVAAARAAQRKADRG